MFLGEIFQTQTQKPWIANPTRAKKIDPTRPGSKISIPLHY